MARAARKKDPVYDPDSDRPITRPDLRVMEGGGQGDGVPQGNLSAASSDSASGGLYNEGGDKGGADPDSSGNQSEGDGSSESGQSSDAVAPDDLESKESTGDSGYANGFDNNRPNRRARAGAFAKRNKNKLIWGTAAGGGIFGLIIGAMITLVPMKIENMVNSLEQRFMHPVNSAIETTNRILLSKYLEKHVIPAYKNCGTTVDRNCKVNIAGPGNPVKNMYKAWAKARLENQFAQKGITLEFDTLSGSEGSWYLKIDGKKTNVGANGEKLEKIFTSSDDNEIKDKIDQAFPDLTKWRKVLMRYKVGRLMTQLHGNKRCLTFCGTKKAVAKPVNEAKYAAKMYLAERVLKPRSEVTFIALKCIMSENCRPDKEVEPDPCIPGNDCPGNGGPTTETEREGRSELNRLAAQYGFTQTDELFRVYTELADEGFQKYMVRTVLTKVFNASVGQRAANAIPVVGWIQLAAQIVNGAHDAAPKIKKLAYITSAAAAVNQAMNYRTEADEIHTGQVDPVEVGSWADSLDQGQEDPKDPLVGGTASAEEAPLYNALLNNAPTPANSAVASIFNIFGSGKVFAASSTNSNNPNYKCNDGKPVPAGELICSEEQLGGGLAAANYVSEWLETTGKPVLVIAQVWDGTVGIAFDLINGVTGLAGDVISKGLEVALQKGCNPIFGIYPIPPPIHDVAVPICKVKDLAEENLPMMIEAAANFLLPNPYGTNMSGGRNFQTAAAGFAIEGKEAGDQIGAQSVSNATVAAIINEQERKSRDQFESQSIASRMFNKDSPYSFVSRVAMITPLNLQASALSGFESLLSNPTAALANGFGAAFSNQRVYAASSNTVDPFKIGNVAFPQEKIPKDPEKYWDDHNCGDTSENGPIARWQKESADAANDERAEDNGGINPNTGMPVHKDVEPCLLIMNVTGVSGGYYDTSLLTKDDLAEIGPSSGDNAADPSTVSGEPAKLAKELISSGRLTGPSKYMDQIKAVSEGDNSCNVNPTLLQMLYGVVVSDGHKVEISSLNRKCTNSLAGAGSNSAHFKDGGGHAVDVVGFDGGSVAGGSGDATLKYLKAASKYLPKGTSYGQVPNCGSGFKIPEGSSAFSEDSCDHQHIGVPVKQLE